MTETHKIQKPKIEEIIRCIKSIQSLDLINADIETIKDNLFLLFKGYVNITPTNPYKSIYRGVIWSNKPNYIADLSYPKPEDVKSYGRVNRPSESIFYGSTSIQAIFHELKLKSGDRVALSKWQVQMPMLLNNIGYTNTCFKNLRSKRNLPSWSVIKDNDKDSDLVNKKIKEYFSEEFTKNIQKGQEYLYKVSVAIAEKHFQDNMFHGLLYPSIAMNAVADNVALKTDFVDDYLTIERTSFVRVNRKEMNQEYQYEVLDNSDEFTESGKIKWAGKSQKWILSNNNSVLNFKVENGRWVARNEKGTIIDPL